MTNHNRRRCGINRKRAAKTKKKNPNLVGDVNLGKVVELAVVQSRVVDAERLLELLDGRDGRHAGQGQGQDDKGGRLHALLFCGGVGTARRARQAERKTCG